MLMTNENIRLYPHDRWLGRFLIQYLPHQLHPNHVTILRFILIPFVLWFVVTEHWAIAMPLFLVTALTDAVDGSMARLRKQITTWGTVADPAADKLLIGSVVVVFVAREINPLFAILIVIIELLIIVSGLIRRRKNFLISANWAGKLKMIAQVTGVASLLLAKLLGWNLLVDFSIGTLSVAIVFAVVSLLTYSL